MLGGKCFESRLNYRSPLPEKCMQKFSGTSLKDPELLLVFNNVGLSYRENSIVLSSQEPPLAGRRLGLMTLGSSAPK